jgi:hypothetical protein
MVKEKQDFTAYSKNRTVLSVSVVDDSDIPVTLSDFAGIYWIMMERPTSPSFLISKELGSGIVVTDSPGGVFTVELASSDMASRSGPYYHEAILVDSSSESFTVMAGTAKIKRSAYELITGSI